MTCHPFIEDDGKGGTFSGIACTRGRRGKKKRQKCGALVDGKLCGESSDLLCDGCDVALCNPHRVKSTRNGEGLDFCPQCFAPAWKSWLATQGVSFLIGKYERRMLFRQWARVNPEAFDGIPLSPLAPGQTRSR